MRFLFLLHNRCKHSANILQELNHKVCFAVCFGNFVAVGL